ncbi:uncharacterized protein C8R40DRAFT_1068472 [Lentinula edodes]|uniref:uncharacterized protein n=1 Tax=Lentinula edodes TaxID=5353 RepID=UPI001E8D4ADC|nr:uncharacterized protein C8R40DRAFT_1068472 [Lentinula edodes]KAH7876690.1 hypothetical protein C8R40DRAFT_1068472 [Lentinula edodes]
MVFSLCMFSFALFFFLPGLSLVFFSQCIFTRRNLASIVVLVSFGFLGGVEAVTGILGASTGSMISSAVLDGFSGMTTIVLLVGSINKINQNRESSIIPNANLGVYAVSMSLLVIGASNEDLPGPTEDVQIPEANPPSPASNRTLTTDAYLDHPTPRTKECTSLNSSSAQIYSIQLNTETETHVGSNKKMLSARPATSPMSCREKKTRLRPTSLDVSRQMETNVDSPQISGCVLPPRTRSSNWHRQHQPPKSDFPPKRVMSQSVLSIAHGIWIFLIAAQLAALLAESLGICIQVVLSGIEDSGPKQEPFGIVMAVIFQNLFFVVQAGCIMCALNSYTHFSRSARDEPFPGSHGSDANSPHTSTNRLQILINNSNSSGPLTDNALRTGSAFLTSFPPSPFCEQHEENIRLDEDVEKCLRALNGNTNLEALDLAFPLTQTTYSVLEQTALPLRPTRTLVHDRQELCQSLSVSVHSGTDVHYTQVASSTVFINDFNSLSHSLNALEFGSPPRSVSFVMAEAEASKTADKLKSTVIFPIQQSQLSIPFDDKQILNDLGKPASLTYRPVSGQLQSSPSRSKKDSFGSKSSRSLKHSRLPSILSLSSLSSSLAKSRLRSFSLTGKNKWTNSPATASMMDLDSENQHDPSTVSLSRSSSFCSPRPKRRAFLSGEMEVKHSADDTQVQLYDLGEKRNQDESQGPNVDVFSSEHHRDESRMRRPDALFPDNRTLSPVPFASYISENTSHIDESTRPASRCSEDQRPPLRPTRSSTFHIFPNFDALVGLGSLGAKLGRGLSGGRSPSPMPTRMLSTGAGEGMIGMRSPTPWRMAGIMEMTKAAVSGAAGVMRPPSGLGMDLLRTKDPLGANGEVMAVERIESHGDENIVKSKQTRNGGRGWICVESEDEEQYASDADVNLCEIRTPKKLSRPAEEDRWTSPSRIPRLKTTVLHSPESLKSNSSSEISASFGLQTPRTPFTPNTPISSFRKLIHSESPQSLPETVSISLNPYDAFRSSPLSTKNKPAFSPPPSSFSSSRFGSKKAPHFGGPVEVFSNDPDPFAGPELGAIVRDSQVNLLREDADKDGYGVQSATRMSAWGNLTLSVPKEKRNPGVGLRRPVGDIRNVSKRNVAASTPPFDRSIDTSDNQTGSVHAETDHSLDSPSAYAQEIVTQARLEAMSLSGPSAVEDMKQREVGDRVSHGSVSQVPVEEALLAQRLLRKLNRRAEGRKAVGGKQRGAQVKNLSGPGASLDVTANSGGRSFLLGMAKTKFLGYGRSTEPEH